MAADAEDMHGKESQVEERVGQNEVNLSQGLVHHASEHFGEPVIDGGEQREDNSRHDVMEVGHDEVGVVDKNIDRRRGHEDAAKTANDEIGDEAEGEEHGRSKTNRPAPQRSQPE